MKFAQFSAFVAERFLMGVAVFVLLVGVGAVEAHHDGTPNPYPYHDHDAPFPWSITKQHWNLSTAITMAENYANGTCNYIHLQRDVDQDHLVTGSTSLDCGVSNCRTATLTYYCEDRPPSYQKVWETQPVEGDLICNDALALQDAEGKGSQRCAAKHPAGSWFMGEYLLLGRESVPYSQCGHGSWGLNFAYQYRILPRCWIDMNGL